MNPVASRGFQLGADSYEKGRPDYADDAVNYLFGELGISSSSTVVDLAAGTGKFTRHLVAKTHARVAAIEPVEGMRSKFREGLSATDLIGGLAEWIPLRDSCVDAVVVAQAFHWFDGHSALREIHRVLRSSGGLGLIWNVRDESVEWMSALGEIINEYWDAGGIPRYWEGEWKRCFVQDEEEKKKNKGTDLFTPLHHEEFRYVQRGGYQTMLNRFLSISYISTLPAEEQKVFLQRITDIFDSRGIISSDGTLEIPYRVDVFTCRRR
jgi:SAM-dependent methyltransferase